MSSSPKRNSSSVERSRKNVSPQLAITPLFKPIRFSNPNLKKRPNVKSNNMPSTLDLSHKVTGLLQATRDQDQENIEAPKNKRLWDDKRHKREKSETIVNSISHEDKALVINILNKDPANRSDGEVRFLQQTLRVLKFFAQAEGEMREKALRDILRKLKIETFDTAQHVFNYGDVGKKFYIIIQGSVYILLKNQGIINDEDQEIISPRRNKKISDEEFKFFLQKDMAEELKTKKLEYYYPGFWAARSMKIGESFGEIALQVDGDRRRTATVVCREPTVLGVVNIDDYQMYLQKLYENKYGGIIDLMSKIHLFKHWSRTQMSELVPHVEETVYVRNQVIFKERDDPQKLYFVMQGEVELWKKMDLEESTSPNSKITSPKSSMSPLRSKILKKKKEIRLAIICAGEYIGAAGLKENKPRDHSAITSSTEARIISLTREQFTMFITDSKSLESISVYIQQKEIWRETITTNYMNIASRYDTMYETNAEKSFKASPVPFFSETSPQNKDLQSPLNHEMDMAHRKIDRLLGPSRSTLRPVLNFLEKPPRPVSKLIPSFTPVSASPQNIGIRTMSRIKRVREQEKIQIVSFEKKSSIKKKLELDVAFSKLQKKLNKLLQEEEEEARVNVESQEAETKETQPAQTQETNLDDFEINFTKNGSPVNQVPTQGDFLISEQFDNLQYSIEADSISKELKDSKDLILAEPKYKRYFNNQPKVRLIRKLGVDRLFQKPEGKPSFLQTYVSFTAEMAERQSLSGSPQMRTLSRMNNSPLCQQIVGKKELHKRDMHTTSTGFLGFRPKALEIPSEDTTNRLLSTKVSTRLYGRVQQALESEKELNGN